MRRADRLFQLLQLIRGRRLSTAAWLAARLEVSVRTVYRDVADLQAQAVPIEGEAGVGYRLGAGYDLPPLMFSQDEARALAAAVRLARAHLDPALALAVEGALSRILAVLPAAARVAVDSLVLHAPGQGSPPSTLACLQRLREATEARRKLRLDYSDLQGRASTRTVRPLGCFFWGEVWTLAAWCEQRSDFRSFRVDRIQALAVLEDGFRDEPGRSLADLLRQVQRECAAGIR
jgi:predicted DNA-binding transcriptional regulator YafY